MRKIVSLIMVILLICLLVGCASAPVEFDPTLTPFEGEWVNWDSDYNKFIYIITGNRWEFTYKNYYSTGLFSYTENIIYTFENIVRTQGKIQFITENGKWAQEYEFEGLHQLTLSQKSTGRIQTGFGPFIKQPYGDLVISYLTKEKSFSDIVSNEEELNKIQGTLKGFSVPVLYTFFGDQFTLTASAGNAPGSGTIKIKDNILYFIVNDELYGILYLYLLSDNKIFLNRFWSYSDLWYGRFIKQ